MAYSHATRNPIEIVTSGKPFFYLHQVRGSTCSAEAFRNADEFVAATAALASLSWSESKNFDRHPLVITDAISAVSARLQMDIGYTTLPLYIDQTEFELNDRWQSDHVAKEAAAKVGMVHPGHQPKGPLAWLRGHFLRLV